MNHLSMVSLHSTPFFRSRFVPLTISIYHYFNRHIMIRFYLFNHLYMGHFPYSKLLNNQRVKSQNISWQILSSRLAYLYYIKYRIISIISS